MAKHIHIHYVKDSKPSIHGLFTKSALEKGASGSGIFLFKYAKLSMSWPYFSKATAQSNLKKRLAEVPSDNPEIYEYSKQECEAELKKSFKDSITIPTNSGTYTISGPNSRYNSLKAKIVTLQQKRPRDRSKEDNLRIIKLSEEALREVQGSEETPGGKNILKELRSGITEAKFLMRDA